MPTVDLPGVGPVERKWVWIGGAAVVGIAGYYWYTKKKPPGSGLVDPTIDPLTGLPYSAENMPQTGFVNPNPVQSVIDGTTGNGITTNTEWTADVIEKLGNIGIDPNYVAGVLGKYLASQPLTLDEAATVRTAWAFSGKPPQGPNTFTLATGSSTPGTSNGGSGNSKSPAVTPAPATWKPPATQQFGSRGDLVRQIQTALKAYGFDPGPIDGNFGSKTMAAVRKFQASRHLTQDGIVGPKTWTALHG